MLFVTNAEKDITNRYVKTLLQSHFSTFQNIHLWWLTRQVARAGGEGSHQQKSIGSFATNPSSSWLWLPDRAQCTITDARRAIKWNAFLLGARLLGLLCQYGI